MDGTYGVESLESRVLLSTTWYVSTTGLNSNAGSLASPFRTIQYAADKAHAGDTVLVRGGTYRETVTMHTTGTAGNPITFAPYNNESVTVDGANLLSGWKKSTGSVYTTYMGTNRGTGNNQIFVDGQMMNEARWPNTTFDLANPVTATIASTSNVTLFSATIQDPNLTQPVNFWKGAILHIAAGQMWTYQTGTVTASGPGFVTFSYYQQNAVSQIPSTGNPYYLSGVAGALDSAGEWFRASNGTLSLWTPTGDSPAAHTVEVKARQFGFDLSNASYVNVQGIHFFACTIKTNANSTAVVFDHITAQYLSNFSISASGWNTIANTGILLAGKNDVLQNSVIVDSAGDGVIVSGANVLVTNNLIHDMDYAGMDYAAIRITGKGDMISYNTIYNCGRDGILFAGTAATITGNSIYNFGTINADLGGIYTDNRNGNGTVISYNNIHDGTKRGFGSVGIMFDDVCTGFIVHHNITWNVSCGTGMNGVSTNMQFYNNTFSSRNFSIGSNGWYDWTGVTFENNIMPKPPVFGFNMVTLDNVSNHGAFVDAANGDFTLLPGAQAIDIGNLIPPYTDGYVGIAPDDGALEYGVPNFSTGATTSSLPTDPSAH